MKNIISFLFCIGLIFQINAATIFGKVTKVLDGDTVYVLDQDNGKFKIRLANIDAPEKTQQFGLESKEQLSNLILNKNVKIKFTQIDMYGRIVGTIFLDDIEINKKMVQLGCAWFYANYSSRQDIKNSEIIAKNKKIGLWKLQNNKQPWIYRKEQRQLQK